MILYIKKRGKIMKRRTPTWVIVLIVAMVVLFYVGFIGLCIFVSDDSDVKTNKNGSVSIDDGQLTIEKGTKGYYDEKTDNFYIIGTLTNNSSDDYDYVTINYHVSDKDGNILGNATDSIDNLEKGKSWKFKVVYENVDAKEVKNFKINNVSTY
jgi:hypothetical protein